MSATSPVTPGTAVTLAASVTGDQPPYDLRFWARHVETAQWTIVRDYAPEATTQWTPVTMGTYHFQVWVRRAGSTADFEAWRAAGPLVVTTLTLSRPVSDVTQHVTGQPATWSVAAAGTASPVAYRFWLWNGCTASWSLLQDYGPSASASWMPSSPCTYRLQVWARGVESAADWEAWSDSGPVEVIDPTAAPLVVSDLRASPATFRLGETEVWTATASGGIAPLSYQFWLWNGCRGTWTLLRDYSPDPSVVWAPAEACAFSLQVWVRSAASLAAWESWRSSGAFIVTDPSIAPLEVTSLTVDVADHYLGHPRTWTAAATGGTGTPEFRFWLWNGCSGSWLLLKDYDPSPSVTWTPSAACEYRLQVWARRQGSLADWEAWRGSETFTAVALIWPAGTVAGARLQLDHTGSTGLLFYNPRTGRQVSVIADPSAVGGFRYQHDHWAPGWTVVPARLDPDDLTDALLYDWSTGAVTLAYNTGSGFRQVPLEEPWAPGWAITVMDLDGDGLDDFLLYGPGNGVWVQALTRDAGQFVFAWDYPALMWPLDAVVLPARFDEGLPGVVVYEPATGGYARYRTRPGPDFGFELLDTGTWSAGLTLLPARFDDNEFTDFFGFARATGEWTRLVARPGAPPYAESTGTTTPYTTLDVGEFSGDGRTDILLYDVMSGGWSLLISPVDPTEAPVIETGTWAPTWLVSVADLDGDGLSDLIGYHPGSGDYDHCRRSSSGGFVCVGGVWSPGGRVVGHVGGQLSDRVDDTWLLSSIVAANFEIPMISTSSMFPSVADVNGDGWLDLLPLFNDGAGTLVEVDLELLGLGDYRPLMADHVNRDTRIADVTGDGLPDLITNAYTTHDAPFRARLFVNQGDGTFAADPAFDALNVRGFGHTILVADFDNDGDLDLFFPNYTHNDPAEQNYLLINDGTGRFHDVADAAGVAMRGWPYEIKVEGAQAADFDRDGDIDFYVGSAFFFNNGNLTFTDRREELGLPAMFDEGIKFLDWNNDGHLDLLLHNPWYGPVLYEFDGTRFRFADVLPVHSYIVSFGLNVYDVNNDGLEDFLVAGGETWDSVLYMNAGLRFVENPVSIISGWGNDCLAFGDFNRDGRIDIAKRNQELTYALNTTPVTGSWLEIEVVDDAGRQNQHGRVVTITPLENLGTVMTRVVDSGSGLMSQNQYALLVGTPFAGPHRVTVFFDDGPRDFLVSPTQRKRLYRDGRMEDLP